MGRPALFDHDKAIAAAELGGGRKAIAERLGVTIRTLTKWMHRHPGFADAVQRGREADANRPPTLEQEFSGLLQLMRKAAHAERPVADPQAAALRARVREEATEVFRLLRERSEAPMPPEPQRSAEQQARPQPTTRPPNTLDILRAIGAARAQQRLPTDAEAGRSRPSIAAARGPAVRHSEQRAGDRGQPSTYRDDTQIELLDPRLGW